MKKKTKKVCSKCKIEKNLEEFTKDKGKKDGLCGHCKACCKACNKLRYQKNKETILKKQKEYRIQNKEAISEREKRYRIQNKEAISERGKKYYIDNKEVISEKLKTYNDSHKQEKKEYDKLYNEKNKEERKEYKKKYFQQPEVKKRVNNYTKERIKKDIQFRLYRKYDGEPTRIIRQNLKNGGRVERVGLDGPTLRAYIESKWLPGMSWQNYGIKEGQWSLDHILPLSHCDLTDQNIVKYICHWTNLRPLWHVDNVNRRHKEQMS